MSDGGDDNLGIEILHTELQDVPAHALHRARQRQRTHHEHEEQGAQHRHENLADDLDAGTKPLLHDDGADRDDRPRTGELQHEGFGGDASVRWQDRRGVEGDVGDVRSGADGIP